MIRTSTTYYMYVVLAFFCLVLKMIKKFLFSKKRTIDENVQLNDF